MMYLGDTIIRQRGVAGGGPYGGTDIDWTTPTTLVMPAEVYAPTSSEEVALAQRVDAQYFVQVYGTADVTPQDRIVWQGDTFDVASAVDKLAARGRVYSLKFTVKRTVQGG